MSQPRPAKRLSATLILLTAAVAFGPAGCAGRQAAAADDSPPSVAVGDSCPASYRPLERKPTATSTGPIVPAGISSATLCTYDSQSRGLTGSAPLPAGKESALAAHLNGLDNWRKGAGEGDECLLGDAAAHQILIRYDGRSNLLVTLDCGVAVRDGFVRQLDSMRTLLGYWPAP